MSYRNPFGIPERPNPWGPCALCFYEMCPKWIGICLTCKKMEEQELIQMWEER